MGFKWVLTGLARGASSLSALATRKAAKDKAQGQRRGMLPLETVAQIKRDLKTMRVIDVAHKYKLEPSRIADIDEGLNYRYVKPAKD